MDPKRLQQLALAKEAGSNKMAKDFFAKTPGTGGADPGADQPGPGADQLGAPGAPGGTPPMDGGGPGPGQPDGDEIPPEQLEELIQLLESMKAQQGNGGQG